MAQTEITAQQDGSLLVSGELVFTQVTALLEQGETLFAGRDEIIVDLRDVIRSDSAGVALLLEWLDRGNTAGTRVCYRNIQDALLRIARLSNIEPLLSWIN